MSAIAVQHFLRRARDFEFSMKLCRDTNRDTEVQLVDTGTRHSNESLQSAALLDIHAAISYADALRIGLGDEELAADDHQKAVTRLRQVLTDRKVEEPKGIQRFSALVGKKSIIAYGKVRTSDSDLKMIVEISQRFSAWINQMGRQLNVEGWGNVATEG
ncbi:MAG: hypothetical protein ACYCOR_07780 [Acidobacteriaceae bacterium]